MPDVIRTSPYIPMNFDEYENCNPNYEKFTKVVSMAIDSVERKKYGYVDFYRNLETFLKTYNIPYPSSEIDLEPIDQMDYEGFSKSVSKVVIDNPNQYKETFETINELMDIFEIPKCEIPQTDKYGGKPLTKRK